MRFSVLTVMYVFYHLFVFEPSSLVLIDPNVKYHYSFHYPSFCTLFMSVIYYFIVILLYCISLINASNNLVSF